MIDRSHALPVKRQAQQLGVGRGSVCYLPRPVSSADLAVVRRIDELHMDYPFAGSRWLIRQPSPLEGLRPKVRGFRFRSPVATAKAARHTMAGVRPAARRVPGGRNGRQAEAPGVMSRSAG